MKLLDQFSGLIASAMLSSHFPEQIITFHCDELKASPKVHIQTKATEELLNGTVCNAVQDGSNFKSRLFKRVPT